MANSETTSGFSRMTAKHWIDKDPKAADPKLVSDIYITIISSSSSASNENKKALHDLSYLKKYLWPLFHPDATDDHVISILILSSMDLDIILADEAKFQTLYFRVMSLFSSVSTLAIEIKIHMVCFVESILQHPKFVKLQKLFTHVFSIIIWEPLTYKEKLLSADPALQEEYAAQTNAIQKFSKEDKANFLLQRKWLYNLLIDHMKILAKEHEKPSESISVYNERMISLIVTIVSHKFTRKYANTLVKELNYLAVLKVYSLQPKLVKLLDIYTRYPINDFTGISDMPEVVKTSSAKFHELQYALYSKFKEQFRWILSVTTTKLEDKLREALKSFTPDQLVEACKAISVELDTEMEKFTPLMMEAIICKLTGALPFSLNSETFSSFISDISIADTQVCPISRSNQFCMDSNDFLLRNLHNEQNNIESSISTTVFKALPDPKKHLKLSENAVNYSHSAIFGDVYCELNYSFQKKSNELRKEFNSIEQGDLVILLQVTASGSHSSKSSKTPSVESMLVAEVMSVERDGGKDADRQRKLIISFKKGQIQDVSNIPKFDCLIRGPPKRSLTKLENIRRMLVSNSLVLPSWSTDYLLGNSPADDTLSTYKSGVQPKFLKLEDTFNSLQNLKSFYKNYKAEIEVGDEPTKKKRKANSSSSTTDVITPPFAIDFTNGKEGALKVHQYTDLSILPTASQTFAPSEVSKILSGTFAGLTVLDSVNKTIISQILNNIIQNFSLEQSTVLSRDETVLSELYELLKVRSPVTLLISNKIEIEAEEKVLLKRVNDLAQTLNVSGCKLETAKDALHLFEQHVEPAWLKYLADLTKEGTAHMVEHYPFAENIKLENGFVDIVRDYKAVTDVFNKLEKLSRDALINDQSLSIINSNIILMSVDQFHDKFRLFHRIDNIIALDKNLQLEIAMCSNEHTKRIVSV